MYRLIHHEAINENMRRHYSQEHERNNLINAYLPIESDNNIDSGQNIQDEGILLPTQNISSSSKSGNAQSTSARN